MKLILEPGSYGLDLFDENGALLYHTSFAANERPCAVRAGRFVCLMLEESSHVFMEVVSLPSFRYVKDIILHGADFEGYMEACRGFGIKQRVSYLLAFDESTGK